MTVQSIDTRFDYNGNGLTTVFSFPAPVYEAGHIAVIITDADGVESEQTLNTDYTVSIAADFSAASITMIVAPATGERLTIIRDVPPVQLTDLQNYDGTPSEIIEKIFDLAAMRDAQQDEALSRAIVFSPASQQSGVIIEDLIANNYLRVNAAGTGIEMSASSGGGGGDGMDGDIYDPANINQQVVGISASQTLTNKTLTSPIITEVTLNTSVTGTAIKDEDDMVSDSNVHLATQQSIKAYVDSQISGLGGDMTASVYDAAGIEEQVVGLTAAQTITNKSIQNCELDAVSIFGGSEITSSTIDSTVIGGTVPNTGTFSTISVVSASVPSGEGFYRPGTGILGVAAAGIMVARFTGNAADVNTLRFDSGTTGTGASIWAEGETNVGLDFITKGTGGFRLFTNNAAQRQLDILHTASAVNRLTLTGSAAGNGVTIANAGTDTNIDIIIDPKGSGALNVSTSRITNVTDPSGAQDAATKNYVDGILAAATNNLASAAVATTANISLTGEQTIDGVLTSASRILVKNQSTASQNGVYVTAAGAWSRATDLDQDAEIPYATVYVTDGSTQGGTQWQLPISSGTIDSTDLNWVQIGGASIYTAGTGLSLVGNAFAINSTVCTLTGAQTLTNKTLTAPIINDAVISYIYSGVDAVARTLSSKLNEAASVLDFGVTGDGSTNDYDNFQNAIDSVGSASGKIRIPRASVSYKLDSAITWPSGRNIELDIDPKALFTGSSTFKVDSLIPAQVGPVFSNKLQSYIYASSSYNNMFAHATFVKQSGSSNTVAVFGGGEGVTGASVWGGNFAANISDNSSGSAIAVEINPQNTGGASNSIYGVVIAAAGFYPTTNAIQMQANNGSCAFSDGIVFNNASFKSFTNTWITNGGSLAPQAGIRFTGAAFGQSAIDIINCSGTYGIRDTGSKTIGLELGGAYSNAIRFLGSGTSMIYGGASTGYTNGIDLRSCNFAGGYEIVTDAFAVQNAGTVEFRASAVSGSAGALQGYVIMGINGALRKVPYYAV